MAGELLDVASLSWRGIEGDRRLAFSGSVLRVQLKSRLTFEKKYLGNELHVAFAVGEAWYLYPHDESLSQVLDATNIGSTDSWERGGYSWPRLSRQLEKMLPPYCITGDTSPLLE